MTSSVIAHADEAIDKGELAGAAYDRAAAAFDAKDYARAAEDFSRADSLAPNTVALKLALDSAMRAGRAAMVMEYATRAEARLTEKPNDDQNAPLSLLVQRAHSEYEDRTGALTVTCAARTCSAQVDDRPWPLNTRSWIGMGRHVLSMSIDGREERRDVVVPPREHVEVRADEVLAQAPISSSKIPRSTFVAPASGSLEERGSRRPLSPTWFWVGAATTAVVGGLAIASGIDTVAKHDDFELSRTSDRASDGREAQTRTNVLLGLTAISAVSTTAIGVFFVNWTHRKSPTRAAAPRTALGLGTCLTITTKF
jgi:hypothetical protein